MFIKKGYSVKDMVFWTRHETLIFILLAAIPTALFEVFGFYWIRLPWLPIALIGTAVAFIISFRNNAAYDRIWEARKIWGGIVNASRTWTIMSRDMVCMDHAKVAISEGELKDHRKRLVYRHIAWMTALRYSMRSKRTWEVFLEDRTNREWAEMMHIPERDLDFAKEIDPLMIPEECEYVAGKTNKPATIISLQSKHISRLKEQGLIWEFAYLELENVLKELVALQGKSERIKNFPYPRQYATLNHLFVWILILLLPLGIIPEFHRMGQALIDQFPVIGENFVWLSIPFTVIVAWVFHTMERIGRVGENPFEGSANDVPISSIARGIEIDIREMIDEPKEKLPDPFPIVKGVQM